jgi:two-component SAPR family response regulator
MFELIDAKTNCKIAFVNTVEEVKMKMKELCMKGFNEYSGNSDELCGNIILIKDVNKNKFINRYIFKRSHKNVNFVSLEGELRRLVNNSPGFFAQKNAINQIKSMI